MNSLLWQPDGSRIASANLTRFADVVGHPLDPTDPRRSYANLHRFSVTDRPSFWQAIWSFCNVQSSESATAVLERGDEFPGSKWFVDARLNFAENLLSRGDDKTALVSVLETGARSTMSYAELTRRVAALGRHFDDIGIAPGDRIAGWLPNVSATIVAMLAAASRGAIWSSCSPDFGTEGALDRFGQIEPRLLVACDGYAYGGKTFDVRTRVDEVARAIPSIESTLWVSILGLVDDDLDRIYAEKGDAEPRYEQLPFDHPLFIMFSSGTTGKPKCIVHGAGGTLLQHVKEHQLHVDLQADDTLFFFTTCGWMMWNWLVSGLATGATLVLFDGSPFAPGPTALIDLIDQEDISVFGVSAKYLSAIEKEGLKPRETHRLDRLKSILSTGSPLTHEGFRYVYRDFKEDVWLASISGGTDIISCFVLGSPWLPVNEGELQAKGLGMDVDVVDERGESLVGEKGELICRQSFPSAPVGFWNDPDEAKYRAAYFDSLANIWSHGDFAELTENDGMIIHGRSDAVLNPGGVRIGTAEIYRQVETVDAIVDSLAIGQEWDDDTRIVLFVVMRENAALTEELQSEIKRRIRQHASPRHVPAVILPVPDVPRTRSGKIAELAVRNVVHGEPVKNTSALANPEVLEAFADRPELAV